MDKFTFESLSALIVNGIGNLSVAFGLGLTDDELLYCTAGILGVCGKHHVNIYDTDALAKVSAQFLFRYATMEIIRKVVKENGVSESFLAIAMADADKIQY